MKKLVLILCMLLCVSLAACGQQQTGSNTGGGDQQTSSEGSKSDPSKQEGSGNIDSYAVAIKDFKLAKSYDGKSVIVISFDFTNNGDNATSAYAALSYEAFQNGVEMDKAYTLSDDTDVETNAQKDIKPGATITCQAAFILSDQKADVEFEVGGFITMSNEKVVQTFAIGK